jgi:hypothetical protein
MKRARHVLTWLLAALMALALTPAMAFADEPAVLTVKLQYGEDEASATVVKAYSAAELEALASSVPAAYLATNHSTPQAWRVYATNKSVGIDALLSDAFGTATTLASGEMLMVGAPDGYSRSFGYQDYQNGHNFYPNTGSALPADSIDAANPESYGPAISLSTKVIDPVVSTAGADFAGIDWASAGENDMRFLIGLQQEAYTTQTGAAANRFVAGVSTITLIKPPALTSFKVYSQITDDAATKTLVKEFSLAELTALRQTDPRGFLMYGSSGWTVQSTNQYIPIPGLIAAAGMSFNEGDKFTVAAADGPGKVTYTWEMLESERYFFPNTTATSNADAANAEDVGCVLALSYASTTAINGTAGLSVTNNLMSGLRNESRIFMGVSAANYQANPPVAAGNRFWSGILEMTVIYPEPPQSADLSGVYTIGTALDAGKSIDIQWGSTAPQAPAWLYDTNYTPAQRYRLEAVADGYYRIVNVASSLVLDVQGGSSADGTPVWQYAWNGSDAQLFKFDQNADGSYTVGSKLADGKVLDIAGASKANGAPLQLYSANGTAAQRLLLNKVAMPVAQSGAMAIVSTLSNKALDAAWGGKSQGTNIQSYTVNGSDAQTFTLTLDGGTGFYTISNPVSGLVLDVEGASSASGANVQLWAPNQTKAQMWTLVDAGNGSYMVYNAVAGMALDLQWAGTADATNVWAYAPNGTDAQKWLIIDYAAG